MCKVMAFDQPKDVPEDAIAFYHQAGFDEDRLNRYRQRFGQFGASISALPAGYQRIQDGQYIDIDGREWRALIGKGHAPEHVCLYCPELKILIAGDQILPRITPNVSVQPSETECESTSGLDPVVYSFSGDIASEFVGITGASRFV